MKSSIRFQIISITMVANFVTLRSKMCEKVSHSSSRIFEHRLKVTLNNESMKP